MYTSTALRQDYRQGIYLGMTFCLFAMPVLTSDSSEEIDGPQGDPQGDQVDGIELQQPMKMQRVADALLDYLDQN